ncbi:hypothetical protein TIFTF001_043728, partial [Ficus carica]
MAPCRNKGENWAYEGLYSFTAHPTVPTVQERHDQTAYASQLFEFSLQKFVPRNGAYPENLGYDSLSLLRRN